MVWLLFHGEWFFLCAASSDNNDMKNIFTVFSISAFICIKQIDSHASSLVFFQYLHGCCIVVPVFVPAIPTVLWCVFLSLWYLYFLCYMVCLCSTGLYKQAFLQYSTLYFYLWPSTVSYLCKGEPPPPLQLPGEHTDHKIASRHHCQIKFSKYHHFATVLYSSQKYYSLAVTGTGKMTPIQLLNGLILFRNFSELSNHICT